MNDSVDESITKERLLDSAEKLFGLHGYEGVGIRALVDDAGVNLGAVTYHFGNKQNLYVEAFLRRFRPASEERLRLLDAAEKKSAGAPLSVELILECVLRPPLMVTAKYPNFYKLMTRNLFMPPPFIAETMQCEMQPYQKRMMAALEASLPHLGKAEILSRIQFCAGAFIFSVHERIAPHSKASPDLSEASLEKKLKQLVTFCAAGLRSRSGLGIAPDE